MRLFALLIGFITLSSLGFAADFHSPRTAALGGASHAGPLLNDAIYLNPSFNSFVSTYGISFNLMNGTLGGDNPAGIPTYKVRSFNVSIQDGRSELFQAGVGLTFRDDSKLLNLGASKALFVDKVGIGLGSKLIFQNTGNGNSNKLIHEPIFSATWSVEKWFTTALIIDNLLESSDAKSRGLYRQFILGTRFNIENVFLIYFDPHTTPSLPATSYMSSQYGYNLGLEFPLMSDFFLRMGRFSNSYLPFFGSQQYAGTHRGSGYGIGGGWIAPKLSLDYGLERMISPVTASVHHFGATIYF